MKKLILITCIIVGLFSCKKEEKSSIVDSSVSSISSLVGKYANSDANVYTRDTIYIYEQTGNYFITTPDTNSDSVNDTIGIVIDGVNITIPSQYINGTAITINGYGSEVLPNQLNLNWSTPGHTVNNAIYIRQ